MWLAGGIVAVLACAFTLGRSSSKKQTEWQANRSVLSRFITKFGGLVKYTFGRRPAISGWEVEIAAKGDLVMHPRVSKLAQMVSDGVILEDLPRIYAPHNPLNVDSVPEGQSVPERDVYCVWHFGSDAVGHPTIVHGGAIAMAFDESFGHAFVSLGKGQGFTGFLNVNYRKPLPAGAPVLITVSVESITGRKVFLQARLTDGSGGTLYSDARALFVVVPAAHPAGGGMPAAAQKPAAPAAEGAEQRSKLA